jgi:hypothetical protein
MAEVIPDAIRQFVLVFYDQDLHEMRITSKVQDKNVEILKCGEAGWRRWEGDKVESGELWNLGFYLVDLAKRCHEQQQLKANLFSKLLSGIADGDVILCPTTACNRTISICTRRTCAGQTTAAILE